MFKDAGNKHRLGGFRFVCHWLHPREDLITQTVTTKPEQRCRLNRALGSLLKARCLNLALALFQRDLRN